MPLFEHWEYQYQFNPIWDAPYEGRTFTDALYEKDADDGRIAYITLNRPDKANALSDAMYMDILCGMHKAADDPEVRVVVLRANGKGFCGGHDLGEEPEQDGRPTRQSSIINPKYRPTIRDYFNLERRRCSKDLDLFTFPKIVIAQIHGYAVWAGEYLVRTADIAIAAENTRFGAWGELHVLETLRVGHDWWYGHPADSKNEGRGPLTELTAQRAVEAGLISKAVPADDLEAEVRRWAVALAELAPEAVLMAKSMINGMLFANGLETGQRTHYGGHVMLQFTRFRPGEVGLYKLRRNATVKAFVEHRERGLREMQFKLPPIERNE